MTPRAPLPDGFYQVAPGKLANAVTWLEMRARPAVALAAPLRLVPANRLSPAAYATLCASIGTPWLWGRAFKAPAPDADAHVGLDDAGDPVGIVEVVGRPEPDIKIEYFGLLPDRVGGGLGRRLMAAALDMAWQTATRVWLHTCNFDHPAALRFYRRCGFVPFASGFEIMDDPRLAGDLPADAAPHVPLIDPDGAGRS